MLHSWLTVTCSTFVSELRAGDRSHAVPDDMLGKLQRAEARSFLIRVTSGNIPK